MKPALVRRTNTRKLVILAVLVLLASVAYLTVDVNPKYLSFAMGLRVPMLLVMLIAAFAIGGRPLCSSPSSTTPSSPPACWG